MAGMNQLGPYSRLPALSKLDGRTKEAKLVHETRSTLLAHLGGQPSAVQAMLIERAVQLTIRIAMMDRKFAETGEQTEHDSRTYLAHSSCLSRSLRHLGLKGVEAKAPSLHELMRRPAPRVGAEAA